MKAFIVSFHLDTNGQNARFARAAAKYGDDPDVLKALAVGNQDPAGVVGRYELAAEKLGGLHIRSAHRVTPYMEFAGDILWTRENEAEVKRLAAEADVIHLNNSDRPLVNLGLRNPRAVLLHHHGSLFRTRTAHFLRTARIKRWVSAVSTMDLRHPAPHVLHWLPTAYDLDELMAIRKAHKRKADGVIRVVSAPTNREYKSTAALEAAVIRLRAQGVKVELVLVEGKTHAETLIEKAKADILFDQTLYSYGCNAVEAWGMGLPVIAGGSPATLAMMRAEWGEVPFYEATEATIGDAIAALVESRDLRAEWAEKGAAHAAKYHAEKPALERLAELYHLALERREIPKAVGPVAAKTYHDPKRRRVLVDGKPLTWDGEGYLTTTDPDEQAELDRRARARRITGISVVEEPAA